MRVAGSRLRLGEQPVTITYEGRRISCRNGDSVAAALVDAGELVCREASFADARGVFCGMGICHECIVTIDGVHGQRACMTPVHDGMSVAVEAPSPTLRPVERPRLERREECPELLVVGGGPGGLAAATAAAEGGIDVVLVDERHKLGGQYFKQPPEAFEADEGLADGQQRRGGELIARARRAGVRTHTGVEVWAAASAREVYAVGETASYVYRPLRLVIATGAYERGVPMPGWTLPGFMATGAAQTLLRAHRVVPGHRVLVSGNGPLNVQVAAELVRAGATVVALCELAPLADPRRGPHLARMLLAAPDLVRDGLGYLWTLRSAGVPLLFGHSVVAAEGDRCVETAVVARIDREGRPVPGTERRVDVDAVCAGFGFMPSNELARAIAVDHEFDPQLHQLTAVRDRNGLTSVDGVWVVGDSARTGGARLAGAVGFLAGVDVVRSLRRAVPRALEHEARAAERARVRNDRFQRALGALHAAPRLVDQLAVLDTLVCRCEGVTLAAVDDALGADVATIGAVKRVTRAGMGRCQGRYCAPLLADLASRRSGTPLAPLDWFAPAPPFKPLPIAIAAAPADT